MPDDDYSDDNYSDANSSGGGSGWSDPEPVRETKPAFPFPSEPVRTTPVFDDTPVEDKPIYWKRDTRQPDRPIFTGNEERDETGEPIKRRVDREEPAARDQGDDDQLCRPTGGYTTDEPTTPGSGTPRADDDECDRTRFRFGQRVADVLYSDTKELPPGNGDDNTGTRLQRERLRQTAQTFAEKAGALTEVDIDSAVAARNSARSEQMIGSLEERPAKSSALGRWTRAAVIATAGLASSGSVNDDERIDPATGKPVATQFQR